MTGSSRVLALRSLPGALPGRMEVIELWPFSQGEMNGGHDLFVDTAFRHGAAIEHSSAIKVTAQCPGSSLVVQLETQA
ncbi:MAG TPA: hypothetical protein VIZ43_23995 [Trebonia sp.]